MILLGLLYSAYQLRKCYYHGKPNSLIDIPQADYRVPDEGLWRISPSFVPKERIDDFYVTILYRVSQFE